jgi:hypothetical protein
MRVNWMNVDEKSQGGSAKLSIADNYQNEAAMIDCAPFFRRLIGNSGAP